jgi:hypothetical protein
MLNQPTRESNASIRKLTLAEMDAVSGATATLPTEPPSGNPPPPPFPHTFPPK